MENLDKMITRRAFSSGIVKATVRSLGSGLEVMGGMNMAQGMIGQEGPAKFIEGVTESGVGLTLQQIVGTDLSKGPSLTGAGIGVGTVLALTRREGNGK